MIESCKSLHKEVISETQKKIFREMHQCLFTLNNAGLFQPKFGSNMDKPKCWVKKVISILTQLQLSLPNVH